MPTRAAPPPLDRTATSSAASSTVRTGNRSDLRRERELPHVSARYELIGECGRGGIGRVLEAFDNELDRFVALKELHHVSTSAEARFIREAKITARLEHPAIVPVHEVGHWDDGTPYYSMKLVAGRSLKQLIVASDTFEQRLALLPNMLAVAEAIGYAHSQRVIHRDLKPSNVIVGEYGETIVIDWGLAKDLDDAEGEDDALGAPYRANARAGLTVAGTVMGTPAYMPPEQARGERVDERADVYSLGAMLYQLLGGRAPHVGKSSEEILGSVLSHEPRPIGELVPALAVELAAIVNKAMARDAGDRYATARALADDLRRYQTGRLVDAHEYTRGQLVRRWLRRYRLPVAVATLALVLLAATALVALGRVLDARDVAQRQRARAERSRDAMILANASSWVERDPAAALGWLDAYTQTECRDVRTAATIALDAAERGAAKHVLRHGDLRIYDIRFSPDGRYLATAGEGNGVVRWDLETLQPSALAGADFSRRVGFAVDGNTVVAGGDDTLRAYDFGTGHVEVLSTQKVRTYPGVSRSGRLAAAYVGGLEVGLWDLVDRSRRDLPTRSDDVFLMEFIDERWLAVTFESPPVVELHDLQSDRIVVLSGHTGAVRDVVRLKNEPVVVTGADDGTLRAWSLDDGAPLGVLASHRRGIWEIDASPDDKWIASGAADGTFFVCTWPARDCTLHAEPRAVVADVEFSPDSRLLAAVDYGGDAWLVHLDDGYTQRLAGHAAEIDIVAFSPNGDLLATADARGELRLWPVPEARSRQLARLDGAISEDLVIDNERGRVWVPAVSGQAALVGFDGTTLAATRTPNGDAVYSVYPIEDGRRAVLMAKHSLWLWEPGTGAIAEIGGDLGVNEWLLVRDIAPDCFLGADFRAPGSVWSFCTDDLDFVARASLEHSVARLRPLGDHWLVIALRDGSVWLHDFRDGRRTRVATHGGPITTLSVAPESLSWATGANDGSVRACSVASMSCRELSLQESVAMVVLARDARSLVVGDESGGVHEFDLDRGVAARIAELPTNIYSIAVTAASELVVVCSGGSGALLAWQRSSGLPLTLRGHARGVTGLAIDPAGKYLLSGGRDGSLRYWDLTKNEFPPLSCAELAEWIRGRTSVTKGITNEEAED